MRYLALSLLLLVGCDQISKKDCIKSCNVLCDDKMKGQKEVGLLLGCQMGCDNITTPCARVGVMSGWGQNETVAYCLHIFRECRKECLKYLEKDNGKEKEVKESKDLQHLWSPGTSHQGRESI